MDYLEHFECFKNFTVEYTTDIKKYSDYSTNECTRWSICNKYYKEQLEICNAGIFITYKPLNHHKDQICAFVLGEINNSNLIIKLVASKRFFLESVSPSFGIYLIHLMILMSEATNVIIDDVVEDKLTYYEHFGFITTSKIKYENGIQLYTMKYDKDVSVFVENISKYILDKFTTFNEFVNLNDRKEELYSCS